MDQKIVFFKEISLLITHYNRSHSLERLLKSINERHIRFNEIIVSDDASRAEHLEQLYRLKEQYNFRLICAEKNQGLGNNINKGQLAVTSPYTLYIQEDFVPTEQFPERLEDGFSLMKENPKIDLIRFYSYFKYPYLEPIRNGFAEMRFSFWQPGYKQFYCYSDHPHLRKSNFMDKFGTYAEGIHSDRTEFKMVISFLQKKGKAFIHDDFKKIFNQENDIMEPSQVPRKRLKKYFQLSNFWLIKFIRDAYRNIKYRIEYLIY